MELIQQLSKIIGKERILDRLVDRLSYASDAGFYELIPLVIVQPQTETEVAEVLCIASQLAIPVCFRGGGTSLSGQAITDGILIDLGRHWRGVYPSEDGKFVTVQPGITGSMVNHFLKPFRRKIGPDPSSIHAAMMGGIISNNASGMCCGVKYNAYHTLQHIRFWLANGSCYDTARKQDFDRFLQEQPQLVQTIQAIKTQIFANISLLQKIQKKYQTKNTVGYGLNAFVDYNHPLDIFAHLLVGAEGTLAFIAEATLQTLPDLPHKATAMLYFSTIQQACDAIVPLTESGAEALELMDRASLRSVEHLPGLPSFFSTLPDGAAALLCEYQTETDEALQEKLLHASQVIQQIQLLHPAQFSTDEKERYFYWKLRKGMFPSVGAVRQRGSTVILEDIAFPVSQLANAVTALQVLFKEYGYPDAIIFGHAKDGNLHFVITQLLNTAAEIDRYDRFLKAVVDLVVNSYDGALKAEHGTGRNMAPFIEAEWGGEAYAIMKAIKVAADPKGILNPGVIINEAKDAHIQHLKQMPVVEEEVDKCIECGFCETSCPSRDYTMTPRRRIVARRALQKLKLKGEHTAAKNLIDEYTFDGLDTCATDGLCATECPVDINTGDLVKRLRNENHSEWQNQIAGFLAKNYKAAEVVARTSVRMISTIDKLFHLHPIHYSTKALHKLMPIVPVWLKQTSGAGKWQSTKEPAQVIYFTACVNRMMSSHNEGKQSLQQTLFSLAAKANIQLVIPAQIAGHCCGQTFTSKGFNEAGRILTEKTIDALLNWSKQGELPVICDFTSCTYTLIQQAKKMSPEYQAKFNKIQWLDALTWLHDSVMPAVTIKRKKEKVALHPVCSATKLHLVEKMKAVATNCAVEVLTPAYAGCCGMAGDRGFLVPGLTQAATRLEVEELATANCSGHYASGSTCEMNLSEHLGKPFEHIAYLLDEVTH